MSGPAFRLRVNGTDLSRWTVAKGTFYRPPVSVRATTVEVPGRHGSISVGLPVFDEPLATLQLAPLASAGSLDGAVADLMATLAAPSLVLERMTDGRTEEAAARLVSASPGEVWVAGRFARVTVVLALPQVFFRDLAAQSIPLDAGVQGIVDVGSGPIGDAVVRFPATGAALKSLTDVTTSTGISVSFSGAGYVFVDCGSLQAWATGDADAWAPTGSDLTSLVGYPGRGPLQLWPILGDAGREVRVQSSHAAMIRARRAWL